MDVRIDADRVRAEREKRAWSQDQLAMTAGVGLRTIQRIESTGAASGETARSLAAVFGCPVHELRVQAPGRGIACLRMTSLTAAAVSAASLLLVFLVATRADAGEIMLDVVLGYPEQDIRVFKLLTEEGKQVEALVDGQFRILLVPTIERDDLILLTAEVYGFDGSGFTLLSRPKVLTRNGVDAKIRLAVADGKTIDINVKPKKL